MKRSIQIILLVVSVHLFSSLLSAQSDQKAELIVETGHTDSIKSISFSPDSKLLVSGSIEQKIKLWELSTGRELKTFDGYKAAFSPDGKLLVIDTRSVTKIIDVQTGLEIKRFPGGQFALSPNGQMIAIRRDNYEISIIDFNSGGELSRITRPESPYITITFAFSSDSKFLARLAAGGSMSVFDSVSGQILNTFDVGMQGFMHEDNGPDRFAIDKYDFFIFGENGSIFKYHDKKIKIYDENGALLKERSAHANPLSDPGAISNNQNLLAYSDGEKVELWNVEKDELSKLGNHDRYITKQ